jgi:glycosyltransferase involved in cell wall biosynthesis
MGKPLKISVVMPTYNRRERCAIALKRLFDQTIPKEEYEVLVVDDGSSDGTREYLESLALQTNLRYLRHNHRGRAATRNLGLRNARGELVLFVDDDVLTTPGLLEKHYEAHETGRNPRQAVLGYTPFDRNLDRTLIVRYFEAERISTWDTGFSPAEWSSSSTPKPSPTTALRSTWAKAYRSSISTDVRLVSRRHSDGNSMDVAIILLNWNGYELTAACLRSLAKSTYAFSTWSSSTTAPRRWTLPPAVRSLSGVKLGSVSEDSRT